MPTPRRTKPKRSLPRPQTFGERDAYLRIATQWQLLAGRKALKEAKPEL
jgi:hypothetical protein